MVLKKEEILGAILIFTPDCENVFQASSKPPVEVKIRKFRQLKVLPLLFGIINQPLSLWHMLVEQSTSAQVLGRS